MDDHPHAKIFHETRPYYDWSSARAPLAALLVTYIHEGFRSKGEIYETGCPAAMCSHDLTLNWVGMRPRIFK